MFVKITQVQVGEIVMDPEGRMRSYRVDSITKVGTQVFLETTCLQNQNQKRCIAGGYSQIIDVLRRPVPRDAQEVMNEVRALAAWIPEG